MCFNVVLLPIISQYSILEICIPIKVKFKKNCKFHPNVISHIKLEKLNHMAKTTSSYWANLPSFLAHLQNSTNIAWPLSNLCGPYLYLHQLVETPPNMIPISPHRLRNLPNILKIRKQASLHYLCISLLHNRPMALDVKPVTYHSRLTSNHLRVTQNTITK